MSALVSGDDLSSRLIDMAQRLTILERSSRTDRSQPFTYVPTRPVGPVTDTLGRIPVSSGTFTTVWKGCIERLTQTAVAVWVEVATPVGSTAEVRLHNLSDGTNTDYHTIASGTTETKRFRWLHGGQLDYGPYYFAIKARVASGAGPIYVAGPDGGLQFYHPPQLTPYATTGGTP